ncbi:MAG: BMC domain-containing protein [Lachnospiraceae bacterium]|nr:BMC domain-containing protein [Lachnospiraceae bacterium]
MDRAYGFLEITGVTAAVDALDIMLKTAGVSFESWERKLGGRLVTIIISGEVAACTEAIENAASKAVKKPVSTGVMANPHDEIAKLVKVSRSRWEKQWKEYLADSGNKGSSGEESDGDQDQSYLYTV